MARGGMRAVEFKVIEVELEDGAEANYCIVGDDTLIEIAEEPLKVRNGHRLAILLITD